MLRTEDLVMTSETTNGTRCTREKVSKREKRSREVRAIIGIAAGNTNSVDNLLWTLEMRPGNGESTHSTKRLTIGSDPQKCAREWCSKEIQ